LVGIAIATFAAAIDIESVVVSGPPILINGIALSAIGTRPRTMGNIFCLSTIAFVVISFLVIFFGQLGPDDAQGPLFAAMVAFQLVFAPIGVWVIYGEAAGRHLPRRLRFGLRQMLAAMVIVCVASGLARLAYSLGDEMRIAVAVGLGTLVIVATAGAVGVWEWIRGAGQEYRGSTTIASTDPLG
jgi:hypothetical protein